MTGAVFFVASGLFYLGITVLLAADKIAKAIKYGGQR